MTSGPRPALFDSVEKIAYAYTENTDASLAISEAIMLLIEAVRAEQAAELAKWKEQRLLDHGRLLWREDVETHCPNADLCFEYSATVRCSPCAIKQSDAEGVEALSLNGVYQPEVARLNRELAKYKALAETLAGALEQMHRAVCHETGFAEAVRADSGLAYPWEPLDVAADASLKALRQYKEARDD